MLELLRHVLRRPALHRAAAGAAASTPLTPAPAALDVDGRTLTSFRCNLCGADNRVTPQALSRETPSCRACGSTVRLRAMAHVLCEALFGDDLSLPERAPRRDVRGVGLSDATCCARPLAERFDYVNTFFHTSPQLDITAIPDDWCGRFDFVLSSDVFEHVTPPVSRAFVNARRLLKPGGVLVLTVPFSLEPATREHFPELFEFRIEMRDGRRRLVNRTRDGRTETFDDLVFHGGDGATLEMRLFSRAAIERELAQAGFRDVRLADAPCATHGIVWPEPWSVPIVARA